MPRRRLQGWRLWGNLADELDDPIDFYDFLRIRGIIDDPIDSSEDFDEFEELIEYYDNQRW